MENSFSKAHQWQCFPSCGSFQLKLSLETKQGSTYKLKKDGAVEFSCKTAILLNSLSICFQFILMGFGAQEYLQDKEMDLLTRYVSQYSFWGGMVFIDQYFAHIAIQPYSSSLILLYFKKLSQSLMIMQLCWWSRNCIPMGRWVTRCQLEVSTKVYLPLERFLIAYGLPGTYAIYATGITFEG